ncbi:hypothetical protein PYCCODRAFT_1107152 [Trametes coccinea BRFM310]|uniref:DUF6533 domain-containing protein n=1 Tax=Trametes coccinea (strain BRFM310) TaxID=1353009 RepID=A0A1Y2I988_TRAC3|nr:hypothetical protein PYCCODRAFT_1107152 [Trametes coccinea BRFM310]
MASLTSPNYPLLASASLLYYDHLLTFSEEVKILWCTKWSLSTVFYSVIRYGTIAVSTLSLVHNLKYGVNANNLWAADSCHAFVGVIVALNMLNFVAVSAFVALRISAIWSHNWYLGGFLFVTGLCNPAAVPELLAFAFNSVPIPWPLAACGIPPDDSSPLQRVTYEYFPLLVSIVNIAYEFLCFSLTALKTRALHEEQWKMGMRERLPTILICDGTIYFGVLSTLAILNIAAALVPSGSISHLFLRNAIVMSRVHTDPYNPLSGRH